MKLHYRLIGDNTGWLAECVESEAAGEGKTPAEAVESLRTALAERLFRPDAVAPPEESSASPIELVLTEDGSSLPERERARSDPKRPIASSSRS